MGDPEIGTSKSILGLMIINIKIKNKNYIGHIPPTSFNDVVEILQKHFGERWKDIYKDPIKKAFNPAKNQY